MADRQRLRQLLVAAAGTCLAGGAAVGRPVLPTVAAVAASGFTLWLAVAAVAARRHARLARDLQAFTRPAEVAGVAVRVGLLPTAAMVAGLWRPQIYCDADTLALLTGEERRALVLHEDGHRRGRDPLRLVALDALAVVLERLGAGRWLQARKARREIAADRYALARGAERPAIASALLKLQPGEQATTVGFRSAAELRLRALLGEPVPAGGSWEWSKVAVGVLLGAAVCAVLVHPVRWPVLLLAAALL